MGQESNGLLSHPWDHVPLKPCFLWGHCNELDMLLRDSSLILCLLEFSFSDWFLSKAFSSSLTVSGH